MKRLFTPRQAEYLAFIAQYRDLIQCSPSEGDIADFFGVSGPSAHQMVVTLEARSLLCRVPGASRSIQLTVSRDILPLLSGPGSFGSDAVAGLTAFGVYLAQRLAAGNHSPLASFAAIHLLAARLEALLVPLGASASALRRARNAVLRVAKARLRSRAPKPLTPILRTVLPATHEPPLSSPSAKERSRKRSAPGQRSLF